MCVASCYILFCHLLCLPGYRFTLMIVVAIATARAPGNMNQAKHGRGHEYRIAIDDGFWIKLANQGAVYQKLNECVARGTAFEEDLDAVEHCVLQLLEALARPVDIGPCPEGGCVGILHQIARRRAAVEMENRQLRAEIAELKNSMCTMERKCTTLSWCMQNMAELDDEVLCGAPVAQPG